MTTTRERSPDAPAAACPTVAAPSNERAAPTRESAHRDERDQPVFASKTHRRARALRVAGWTLAAITALWLIALVLGAFGLRPLPAIGMPQVPGAGEGPGAAKRTANDPATGELTGPRRNGGAADGQPASGSAGAGGRSTSQRSGGDEPTSDAPSGTPGGGGGSSPSSSTPAAGSSTPAANSATPPAGASPGNGNSANAPGHNPEPKADKAPGKSGSAPGAAVSDERRGGPKTPKTP